jgi:hypothetical protein
MARDVEWLRRVAVRLARRKRQPKNIARDQSEPHLRSKLVRIRIPTMRPEEIAMEDVERRVIGKVMRRPIPFLVLCCFVAYLDRVNVSFAKSFT